jgi:hypothetical protein
MNLGSGLAREERVNLRFASLLIVAGLGGCITPSIPIPPPEPMAMTFALDLQAESATFSYRATDRYALALVYVFNDTRGVGVIDTAREDGSVGPTAPFPAAVGEQVVVTFEVEDTSVSRCVILREGTPSAFDSCR